MKQEILENLENPKHLEKLYRNNKTSFKKEFNSIYTDINQNPVAKFWYERLNFETEGKFLEKKHELLFIILISAFAGLFAKIPYVISKVAEYYFEKNAAFIIFPLLSIYFAWRQSLNPKKTLWLSAISVFALVFINVLPNKPTSQTFFLSCMHMPFFLWAILGYTYCNYNNKAYQKRLEFLRFNGDLLLMTTIILTSGIIMTFISIELFQLIEINFQDLFLEYIVVWGIAASPIVATYLIQTNPQVINRVSPIIARVFTPLVLVTLVIYLVAVIKTGKDPYNDRSFLLVFNLLLLGVMALIVFSIAETSKQSVSKISLILLLALSIVTIICNAIALSAILFRISEWGFTPNRLVILGGNILILTNLLFVTYSLFKTVKNSKKIELVEKSIAKFLPIYCIWTLIVSFILPILFNFK